MSKPTKCPDRRWYERLASGNVTADQEQKLSRHLSRCKDCQRVMESQLSSELAQPTLNQKTDESHYFHEKLSEIKSRPTSTRQTSGYTDILPWLEEADEAIGRIQEFELQEFVGRGGMGVVFRCYDSRLERNVALKFMSPSLLATEAAAERFVREARSAARINHPNVVTLHSVSEVGDLPYLVMEYVNGKSLEKQINDSSLALPAIIKTATQITRGLAAAHQQGVLHRDIKPANIMLDLESDQVKITDFGLACTVENSSLTRSGLLLGTPEFISPEQIASKEIDQRSDLFSLGSLLYLMCTGTLPFSATTLMGTLDQVCKVPHRSVSELNPNIPGWLVAIIDKLLEKDPNDRFNSAKQVLQAFESHQQSKQDNPLLPKVVTTKATKKSSPVKSTLIPTLMMGGALLGLIAVLLIVFQWQKSNQTTSNKAANQNSAPASSQLTVTSAEEFRQALSASTGDLTIQLEANRSIEFDNTIHIENREVSIVGDPTGTSKLSWTVSDDPGLQLVNGTLTIDRVILEGLAKRTPNEDTEALLTCENSQLILQRSRIVCPDSFVGIELSGSSFRCDSSELFARDVALTTFGDADDKLEIKNSIIVATTSIELCEPQRAQVEIDDSLMINEQFLYLSNDGEGRYDLTLHASGNIFDGKSAFVFCEFDVNDDFEKVSDLLDYVQVDWNGSNNCLPKTLLCVENEHGAKRVSYSKSNWSNLVSDSDKTSFHEAVTYQKPREQFVDSVFREPVSPILFKPKTPDNVGPNYSKVGPGSLD